MPHIRMRQQVLEQIAGGRIEPLQVVEEQGKRMLRPREHGKKAPEDELETSLRNRFNSINVRRPRICE